MRINIAIAAAASLFLPALARADRRAYGETYEAVTAPAGELDLELWTTWAEDGEVPSAAASRGVRTMVELEYGVTDRWDVALYNLFDLGTTGSDPGYAGVKLETRYRLSLPGEWPVDPIIYLEYQRLFRGDAPQKFEVKAIVARDLGRWNVALNLAAEGERFLGGTWNPEAEWALGVSRELSPSWRLGLEVFGKVEKPEDALEVFAWVGPAVSWGTSFEGRMRGLWLTAAAGRGLTEESQAFYGRLIVGLQF
jgi:hypothetical protein